MAAVQGAPGRRRARRPSVRARDAASTSARRLRRRRRRHRLARLGGDPGPRARARHSASSTDSPEGMTLHGSQTMDGRVPTFCFSVPGRSAESVAEHLAEHETSRSGGATTTRSRRSGGSGWTRTTAPSGPESSTTTRPRRSTGCWPGSRSSCEAPPARRPEVRRPCVVDAALARGHEVTLFNRGTTNPELFPEVEPIARRSRRQSRRRSGREWDAVVDTSGYLPRIVTAGAELLARRGRPLRLRLDHLRLRVVRRGRRRELAARAAHRAGLRGHRGELRRAQGALRGGGRDAFPGR